MNIVSLRAWRLKPAAWNDNMNISGIEFFDELLECVQSGMPFHDQYVRMRAILERACKLLTIHENIQFSNLFSRLNYVCHTTALSKRKTYQINTFRIHANQVLKTGYQPTEDEYLHDLKALCYALHHFFAVDIPAELSALLPLIDLYEPKARVNGIKYDRIRVEVVDIDQDYLYAIDEENAADEPVKIKHHETGFNLEFNETIGKLWKDCQLNLIDVVVDEDNIYYPAIIILEPDYLIDISALAECMKEYGNSPLNYIQSKFEALRNTKHILLGNAANQFLDEFVNEQPGEPVEYKKAIMKAFKTLPFEYSTCVDLKEKSNEMSFFMETKSQFDNIKRVVAKAFPPKHINRENALLEPSFICEQLGVQGRLDYLQLQSNTNEQFVIELKSGKAPFPEDNIALIGKNHRSQLFIYQILIQKVLGIPFSQLKAFILYSKYTDEDANLRVSQPYMTAIKEILNIRNLIVANEHKIATDAAENETKNIIHAITPENLVNVVGSTNKNFIERFIVPQINAFKQPFAQASPLALAYFHSFYAFVTKEHYISKAGDTEYDSNKGIASLWLSSLEEKFEAGEILYDLTITKQQAAAAKPTITLDIPIYEKEFLPNFRVGDIVILYQRNHITDNVTNKQIFKGSIEALSPHSITIRLRNQQRNASVIPMESKYAVEHDHIDASYTAMYRGLYALLQANNDRVSLLLHQRAPLVDERLQLTTNHHSEEVTNIVRKAKQAKDYFLLIGPPGTGKTSVALKHMLEEFYSDDACNILLLSYTNRAVDEICECLETVQQQPHYIRIGSALSCDPRFRHRLLDEVIAGCNNRTEVRDVVQQHRVFVGTVASVSGKMELFKLKHFQVSIVDEASQILEPHLLGILSAKDVEGRNAIDKFILIGDHKQLPAVVLQSAEEAMVKDPNLQAIGLINRNNSLFERLHRLHKHDADSPLWSMLHKQGRMHPSIALFPNYAFYQAQLHPVPTPHQSGDIGFTQFDEHNPVEKLIATERLVFIPSNKSKAQKNNKTNNDEANIAACLVKHLYQLYQKNPSLTFSPEKSIGIITPYRSQIALIKRKIHALGIPALNMITVDTVERFQGSQRDFVVYSFCVNQYHQLDFLANNMEEDGQMVDRKLNVAITRARKQMFVTGNPSLLSSNLTYFRFMELIRAKHGYLYTNAADFCTGKFQHVPVGIPLPMALPLFFDGLFEQVVEKKLKEHPATQYPISILGNTDDFNHLNIVEYGRADFDAACYATSAAEKCLVYAYYYMRKHIVGSLAVLDNFKTPLQTFIQQHHRRVTLVDVGCGPSTMAQAWEDTFGASFHYIGVDPSTAMLDLAKSFLATAAFQHQTTSHVHEISESYWEQHWEKSHVVIINFAHVFANLSKEDAEQWAIQITRWQEQFPLNTFLILYQNNATEGSNRMYGLFKKLLPQFSNISSPYKQYVCYHDVDMSIFDTHINMYAELLGK
ncbi:AAA domain-containing protein [Chitinophaga skermanii]|nr:AAA domain-containing protein [Chitinophaga skermanii]